MLFNSIDFAIFLPIVFFFYWFIVKDSIKLQNILIVVASYVFYGWWDWKFLPLSYSIPFLNYNMEQWSQINSTKEYFSDPGHLNTKGSIAFTKRLTKDLKNIIR
mgnify:CR=1 FL=1